MDLTHNLIGKVGAKALADSLKDCGLEMLFLGRNSIGEQGALAFAEALSSGNTSLKSLDIHMNEIGDDAGETFFSVLDKTGLQTLRIDSNNLGEKSIIQMCNTLPFSDLEVLYIGGNRLEERLIEKIAQVLNKSKIRKLCLNDTSLNNDGVFALSKAIKSNNIIETLDIRDNPEIDDEGLGSIFDAIKSHPSIQHVVTSGTTGSSKLQNAIEVYVSSLRSKRASIITSLLSVKFVPSIGTRSFLQNLPIDLFRTLGEML